MRPLFPFLTFSLALFLGKLQLSFAAPNHSSNAGTPRLKDSVPPPSNWLDLGRAPPTQVILLRIALPQARFSELERQLYEISDPSHARYGQHLMKEQVEELVRPDRRNVGAVDAWLAKYDIGGEAVQRSRAGDWVTIRVPVALAEEMLDTEFHLWKHYKDDDNKDVLVRTTQYSLPEDLHAHIELIQPTTYFGRPKAMSTSFLLEPLDVLKVNITVSLGSPSPSATPVNGSSPIFTDPNFGTNCSEMITVSCLLEMYNVAGYQPAATAENGIGITGYLGQFANMADLQSFYAAERPEAVNSTFKTVLVNDGQNDQTPENAGIEANLDTQFGFGIAFPTPGTFFSTGGSPPFVPDALTPSDTNEPYDDWLQFVLGMRADSVPQTISTSYGDDEQTVPKDYAIRVCREFALLGSRGVSVIFSSGDGGVGDGDPDPTTQQCISNDGKNQTRFIPEFPASCPYITAVGGTSGIPEVAAHFSGGGFSNYFGRPSYQNLAVQTYLNSLPTGQYQGLFNPYAYPDVSAQSRHFLMWFQGQGMLVSGTSASTPTFAAIIALLNDASIAACKPPLGFLNPMLYSIGAAGLNDVTAGNNPGCGTPGFNASKGWDPVTGLGTPDFSKLKNILSSWTPPAPTLLGGSSREHPQPESLCEHLAQNIVEKEENRGMYLPRQIILDFRG
ncbi:subtilisin-like protein [Russula earlei]|uniref:Subtilisin-like protein n=1 Tax=Russula earlei TaxID=71964 RepID=A0ACC0U1L3_9AGAM|nr:subtilisin-like protein [Russula earlei]